MFETSVVPAQARASRGRIGLLTASIVAHSAIVLGGVAVSIASVNFPAVAPDEYRAAPIFDSVRIPPPLGNPNGGGPQPAQPVAAKPVATKPNQITAPSAVPETVIPVADAPVQGTGDATTNATGTATEPGPVGVPWGEPNSIGDLDAPPAPIDIPVQVETKVYQAHEVKAPVLLHKVEPRYPQIASRTGLTATVVVRCIIDKNGRVRDAEVVVPAPFATFDAAVLDAIQHWRFTPGAVRGQAVDSYFNLTVRFSVKR